MANENFIIEEEQNTAIATPVDTCEVNDTFSVLSKIKLDKYVHKLYDGSLYIKWADAWGLVKGHFPTANYRVIKNDVGWNFHVANGEGYVEVGVTIQGIEYVVIRPILEGKKSKKVENITQLDVNKATQRALTKACAMHGLGLKLWSDLEVDWTDDEQASESLPSNLQPGGLSKPGKTQVNVAPQIPSPQIPAPSSAPAPNPQQNTAMAPATATSPKVTYMFPGDSKSIVVSNQEAPLVFKTVENYREEDLDRMKKAPFSVNEEIFVKAGVFGWKIQDALNTLIGHHNTEALKVLSEKLEGFDFENAEQSEIPATVKASLYAIACVLHHALSVKREKI